LLCKNNTDETRTMVQRINNYISWSLSYSSVMPLLLLYDGDGYCATMVSFILVFTDNWFPNCAMALFIASIY